MVGHAIKNDFNALELPMYPTAHRVFDMATNASLMRGGLSAMMKFSVS